MQYSTPKGPMNKTCYRRSRHILRLRSQIFLFYIMPPLMKVFFFRPPTSSTSLGGGTKCKERETVVFLNFKKFPLYFIPPPLKKKQKLLLFFYKLQEYLSYPQNFFVFYVVALRPGRFLGFLPHHSQPINKIIG